MPKTITVPLWWAMLCQAHGRDAADPDAFHDWTPLRLRVERTKAKQEWGRRPVEIELVDRPS